MSEEGSPERTLSPEEIPEVAGKYLDASDEQPEHQERLDEIDAELNELESTRQEVADDMGEEHFLVEEIDADIQELEDEREDLRGSTEDIAQLRRDLLRAAAEEPGFRFNEHWLNSKTLRALTDALYGTEDDMLVISDQELRNPDDADGLSRMQQIQITREIVQLAHDQLTGNEGVANRWEEFEDSRAHQAFPVIAQNPGVGPSEIAEAYDEKTPSTVRNWTSDLSSQEDLKMVYTPKQGEYHLSTVGKYYAAHYADIDGADYMADVVGIDARSAGDSADTAIEVTEEESDDDEDSEQVGLGNSSETSEDEPGESTRAEPSETLSEAKTTEEKAEALFNDVSEARED